MRLLPVLLVLLALTVAGCGSSSSSDSAASTSAAKTTTASSPTHLATAKFVLHAGLAFGAFHRYIYKPLRAGAFTSLLRQACGRQGDRGRGLRSARAEARERRCESEPVASQAHSPADASYSRFQRGACQAQERALQPARNRNRQLGRRLDQARRRCRRCTHHREQPGGSLSEGPIVNSSSPCYASAANAIIGREIAHQAPRRRTSR